MAGHSKWANIQHRKKAQDATGEVVHAVDRAVPVGIQAHQQVERREGDRQREDDGPRRNIIAQV